MRAASLSVMAGVGWLLTGGCSGRPLAPADAVFTDGSRLKAIWEQAPGAPKRQVGWYDTELHTTCLFTVAGAPAAVHSVFEKQYCFPYPRAAVTLDGPRPFLDEACTQEIVELSCDERFAIWSQPSPPYDNCGLNPRVFNVGAQVAAGFTGYDGDGQGGCKPGHPADASWHALGEEIPLDALVSATVELPTGDGPRIRTAMLRASDGASQPIAAWDSQRGESVSIPAWDYDDPFSRWEPDSLATRVTNFGGLEYFANADCTGWLGSALTCGTDPIRSISEITGESCHHALAVRTYEIGAPVDPGTVRVFDTTSVVCRTLLASSLPLDATLRFFTPGAPIPDDALAAAEIDDQGTGPIKLRVPGSGDGPVDIGSGFFFDSQFKQRCAAMRAADGSLRCFPSYIGGAAGSYIPYLYADPACTAPLASYEKVADGCTMPTPAVASILQTSARGSACQEVDTYRAYQVVGPHTGPVYAGEGANCFEDHVSADLLALFDTGPEIPLDALAPITTSAHYPGW